MVFASWGPLGRPLGGLLGRLSAIMGRLGAILGRPGVLRLSSELLRAILEASRAALAARWRHHENPGVARSSQGFEAPPPRPAFWWRRGPPSRQKTGGRKREAGNRTGETKGQTTKRTAPKPLIAALRPRRGPADLTCLLIDRLMDESIDGLSE